MVDLRRQTEKFRKEQQQRFEAFDEKLAQFYNEKQEQDMQLLSSISIVRQSILGFRTLKSQEIAAPIDAVQLFDERPEKKSEAKVTDLDEELVEKKTEKSNKVSDEFQVGVFDINGLKGVKENLVGKGKKKDQMQEIHEASVVAHNLFDKKSEKELFKDHPYSNAFFDVFQFDFRVLFKTKSVEYFEQLDLEEALERRKSITTTQCDFRNKVKADGDQPSYLFDRGKTNPSLKKPFLIEQLMFPFDGGKQSKAKFGHQVQRIMGLLFQLQV